MLKDQADERKKVEMQKEETKMLVREGETERRWHPPILVGAGTDRWSEERGAPEGG